MEGIPHFYNGRQISTENFRAFIYGADGKQKLVNSWREFEEHMQTGIWFADKKDIPVIEKDSTAHDAQRTLRKRGK